MLQANFFVLVYFEILLTFFHQNKNQQRCDDADNFYNLKKEKIFDTWSKEFATYHN